MRESQLILTVRDAAEVRAIEPALVESEAAGIAISWALDVKDPRSGSLGRPNVADVTAILQVVDGRWPVSVAWGELAEYASAGLEPPVAWRGHVDLLKLGLAGLAGCHDWPKRFAEATRRMRQVADVVAVIYVDGHPCDAPAPADIVRAAVDCDCPVVLIDTFDKRLGPLTSHWSASRLQRWINRIHDSGRQVAVAGSLRAEDLPAVHACGPDYVALRSALCAQGRSGQLSIDRVRDICDRWVKLTSLGPTPSAGNRAAIARLGRHATDRASVGPLLADKLAVAARDGSGHGGRS